MKTTGIFTTHQVDIQMKESNEVFHLIPFGDVHRDSPHHALEHWKEDLARWERTPNAIFLGMGDFTDFLSTSERGIIGGGLHESTMSRLEKSARGEIENLSDELSFMKGRLIGLLNGNHFYQFSDGTTGDHMLANLLETKFLGTSSFIKLTFRWPKSTKSSSLVIFANHGQGGGGRTVGGSLNTVQHMADFVDADIVLQGHDHKRGILPLNPILSLSEHRKGGLRLKERQRYVGRTGSYLKAYIEGQASYNVDAGRGPCSLGHIEFEITPQRVTTNGDDECRIKVRGIA